MNNVVLWNPAKWNFAYTEDGAAASRWHDEILHKSSLSNLFKSPNLGILLKKVKKTPKEGRMVYETQIRIQKEIVPSRIVQVKV